MTASFRLPSLYAKLPPAAQLGEPAGGFLDGAFVVFVVLDVLVDLRRLVALVELVVVVLLELLVVELLLFIVSVLLHPISTNAHNTQKAKKVLVSIGELLVGYWRNLPTAQ